MYDFIKKIFLFKRNDKIFHVQVPKNLDNEMAEALRQLGVSESEIKSMTASRNKLIDREET
tara:strand:+ start:260 stop:442 length:183 start_codon:yes stop_codon:yes gene_type:complete